MDESDLFRLLDAVAALVTTRFPGARREVVAAASMVVVANNPPTDAVDFACVVLLAEKSSSAVIDANMLLDDPTFAALGRGAGVLEAISALCCADVATTVNDAWFAMVDVMTEWPSLAAADRVELSEFNMTTFMAWVDANV